MQQRDALIWNNFHVFRCCTLNVPVYGATCNQQIYGMYHYMKVLCKLLSDPLDVPLLTVHTVSLSVCGTGLLQALTQA